ncbi:cation:proton antiporter [Nakamurella multipartita]|uniref:Sodium/hydrogen exchanger n=1 Tax=Nakamurella multipartita (strain ATCC 700099 / DSM 44233 / CIP 104796 / JCM 9543 / NBRC 105858 / Y-104) TaxID=479431 RepID=C8X7P6_NAKMY|nr:cation:proton antiporter [Nakamurella multipartita]ACV78999.1 sodium/hydrogen exchanger [Nakamurella multipartita DSM 44233]
MHTSIALLLELGIILAVLSALGALARRFALTPIPLYLLAGLLLGEGGLATVPAAAEFVEIGGSIGVVLLLLTLGLEFSVVELTASLRRHLPSALLDGLLNAAPGALVGWLLGLDPLGMLALAGATWVSSSGIVSRLLGDLDRLGNRETAAVLSVLVLEDFAMAVYLPPLAVLAAGGAGWRALVSALLAAAAVGSAFLVTRRWSRVIGRALSHPEPEQLLLRILGVTLVVAGLAELAGASAAVGAFLVGLCLSGPVADRARVVLSPLRDLFAAIYFLAIGFAIAPAALLPVWPVALGLALVTMATKILSGAYAASRDGVGRRGQLRAGVALIPRGEFSLVIVGLTATAVPRLEPLVAAYVLIVATVGPVIVRFT